MIKEKLQVEKDINRTFPNSPYFTDILNNGQSSLERVLICFAKHDPEIGYVQGMNFLVGTLLLHCSEVIAFTIFVNLLENYQIRDIFLPGIFH